MSRASIGEVVAKTLEGKPTEAAITGERTIENITSEIIQLKTDAGNAIIGIGQRLNEAKELLPHGEWLPWLSDQVEFSERTAQDFMRLAREWTNPQTLADFGKAKALKLLLLPPAERDEFMQTHDVPNMSTRELEDAIRERDEARKRAEEAEKMMARALADRTSAHNEMMETQIKLQDANAKIKELESAPKELYKDEAAIQKAADEARKKTVEEWQKKHEKFVADLEKTEAKLKEAKEKAKINKADVEAGNKALADLDAAQKAQAAAEAEAERLRAELAEAQKAAKAASVAGDAEVSEFKLYFGLAQENINKMRGLLLKVRSREDKTTGEKLSAAMAALGDAVKEAAK